MRKDKNHKNGNVFKHPRINNYLLLNNIGYFRKSYQIKNLIINNRDILLYL